MKTILTKEQSNEIERLSGLLFSPGQIVTIMQLDQSEFDNKSRFESDDFHLPYQRGKLMREAEIRTSIFNLAQNGSSPAQILAMQLFSNSELNNIPL